MLRRLIHSASAEKMAAAGVCGVLLLLLPALFAPLLANGRPLLAWGGGYGDALCFPFLRSFFAPDSTEYFIEQLFNYAMLFSISALPLLLWKKGRICGIITALLLLLPFIFTSPRLDRTDYRAKNGHAVFAPVPYGPFEIAGEPYEKPSARHILGTDEIGRSVASRMLYGARVSLAVGLLATSLAMTIGCIAGMLAGYLKGKFDLFIMRLIEILMCFPTFLLLLILMSMAGDCKFQQSILIVIAVIGLTGWIGTAFLVRGEVLKESTRPYIESGVVAGLPMRRILFVHLLPNIAGPLLISFSFGVAGAILAESSLSFLGFGVCTPTPSWGNLLRQAFDNPLLHYHLMLFPGLALLLAICSFNFIGEGLRKYLAAGK